MGNSRQVGKAPWLTGGFGKSRVCSQEWRVVENEDIGPEYISWIFLLTSSRLLVLGEVHWACSPSLCALRPLCDTKQSLVCWDKQELTHFKPALLTQTSVQTWSYCCCAIAWRSQSTWHSIFSTYCGGMKLKHGPWNMTHKLWSWYPGILISCEGICKSIGNLTCCKSVKRLGRGSFLPPPNLLFIIFCLLCYLHICPNNKINYVLFSLTKKITFLFLTKDCEINFW